VERKVREFNSSIFCPGELLPPLTPQATPACLTPSLQRPWVTMQWLGTHRIFIVTLTMSLLHSCIAHKEFFFQQGHSVLPKHGQFSFFCIAWVPQPQNPDRSVPWKSTLAVGLDILHYSSRDIKTEQKMWSFYEHINVLSLIHCNNTSSHLCSLFMNISANNFTGWNSLRKKIIQILENIAKKTLYYNCDSTSYISQSWSICVPHWIFLSSYDKSIWMRIQILNI